MHIAIIYMGGGYAGGVPSLVRKRDLICLFQNGQVRYISREADGPCGWIGEAYVYGMMFEEALRDADPSTVDIFHVQ